MKSGEFGRSLLGRKIDLHWSIIDLKTPVVLGDRAYRPDLVPFTTQSPLTIIYKN